MHRGRRRPASPHVAGGGRLFLVASHSSRRTQRITKAKTLHYNYNSRPSTHSHAAAHIVTARAALSRPVRRPSCLRLRALYRAPTRPGRAETGEPARFANGDQLSTPRARVRTRNLVGASLTPPPLLPTRKHARGQHSRTQHLLTLADRHKRTGRVGAANCRRVPPWSQPQSIAGAPGFGPQ